MSAIRSRTIDAETKMAYSVGERSDRARAMRRVTVVMGITVALGLPAPVAAWDQLLPPPQTDYVGCQNSNASPCIEWPKTAQNLSINVDVYLASSLGGANIDLRPDIRAVFPKWNEIDARNPHLQETTSTSNEEVWVALAMIDFDASILAITQLKPSCAAYGGGWSCAAPGYKIGAAKLYFNAWHVTWNHSYSFGCNATDCWGDSRYTAAHEFGHVEGLGHVHPNASFASVMKGPVSTASQWWPAVDDHNGIIGIYGAYP